MRRSTVEACPSDRRGPTPEKPIESAVVLDELASAADPGLTSPAGSRFFGWVMGGSHPLGAAADMMVSGWGQNAGGFACSPAAAMAEKVASGWLLDLLGLPARSSVGFVTGATMAAFTCLAAARHALLARAGWDVEVDGLFEAPPIRVFAGDEVHATNVSAMRYLGLGSRVETVSTDSEGRIDVDELDLALGRHVGPAIVIAGAGQINSGSFDRFAQIAAVCRRHEAWLHVDGAFGLWARLLPEKAHLLDGIDLADSWSVDGHKWLQLPYDSGFAIVRDRRAHAASMAIRASYLLAAEGIEHDPSQYVPELSRRARGFAAWAMIKGFGREGLAEMVRSRCMLTERLGAALSSKHGISVVNEIVLNQLVVRFGAGDDADRDDRLSDAVIERLRARGRVLALGANWKGRRVLRASVTSHAIDEAAIDAFAAEIIESWNEVEAELRVSRRDTVQAIE